MARSSCDLLNCPCNLAAICAPITAPGTMYTTRDQGMARTPPASTKALICTPAQAAVGVCEVRTAASAVQWRGGGVAGWQGGRVAGFEAGWRGDLSYRHRPHK